MAPIGADAYGENSPYDPPRQTMGMGSFRHRQDSRGTPDWVQTYLSFDLDTMESTMNAARFDTLLRPLSAPASRRGALAALASGLLAVGPLARGGQEAEAKKKHKKKKPSHTRKPSLNAFGCVDVGKACLGNDNLCCSGMCQGKKPKQGRKDKSTCVAHHTGDCSREKTFCTANLLDSKCGPDGADAYCQTTTGNADFCANVENFSLMSSPCRSCSRDADCEAITGPGSACVVIDGGSHCDGKYSCTRRGSSNGTTCLPAGV
jgi:hypothetical protein